MIVLRFSTLLMISEFLGDFENTGITLTKKRKHTITILLVIFNNVFMVKKLYQVFWDKNYKIKTKTALYNTFWDKITEMTVDSKYKQIYTLSVNFNWDRKDNVESTKRD